MKRPKESLKSSPQYDYGLALQNAVSWLGDRYLLAQPVTRRVETPPQFYVQPRRWHEVAGPARARSRKH